MNKIMRQVWAEIDLDAAKCNIRNIKKIVGSKEVIAVVKADAYGHGAIDLAPVFINNGASKLAVALITEALELIENNINVPIIILGYTPLEYGEDLIKNDIEQTVYDLEYAKGLSEMALSLGKTAKIHIAVDTGMGRIGFLPKDKNIKIIEEISALEGISIEGLFTHFATSDEENKEYTYEQFSKLKEFINKLEERGINIPLKHVSNSGAIIDLPETYLDGVRAGIILYGYYPSEKVKKENLTLKNVMTVKTMVCHVKILDRDMYVSYGRTFKTNRESIIATLPIGYGDGYSRLLSGKAQVIINGKLAPVVGRICMDQCMIDVTDVGEVKVGDEVIILGQADNLKFNADDMAKAMGTINYEVLCMIKQRIPRVYIENGKVVNVRNYI
ncbi:alanine racemase [Clostridium vincentii]|uniref:Alanine racemase n=1 Tax=Clostridium vincentii TaxID=52704 RepID=A0A2T0B7I9_9CLOT|nr:alanine racemase [Clostridium vincentii]PRR79783.1 Alanine racemase [Clostridium vincentii]